MDKDKAVNATCDGKTRIPITELDGVIVEQVPSSSLIWLKINISDEEFTEMRLDDESADHDEETDYRKLIDSINALVLRYYPELQFFTIEWNDISDPTKCFDGEHTFLVSDFDLGEEDA